MRTILICNKCGEPQSGRPAAVPVALRWGRAGRQLAVWAQFPGGALWPLIRAAQMGRLGWAGSVGPARNVVWALKPGAARRLKPRSAVC